MEKNTPKKPILFNVPQFLTQRFSRLCLDKCGSCEQWNRCLVNWNNGASRQQPKLLKNVPKNVSSTIIKVERQNMVNGNWNVNIIFG